MNVLVALPYSPWSEKAKWALDARRVPYAYRMFSPLVGEPALRAKTGKWRGPITVPVLIDDAGKCYDDSAKIARFADQRGAGPTLFPQEEEATIQRWIDASERGLSAGRARSLERTLKDDAALAELVPRKLRGLLGRLAPRVGEIGVKRTLRKYRSLDQSVDQHLVTMREVLGELREALGTRATILESFSFADVAASQILTFLTPPKFGVRIGEASRRGFTDGALAEEFADLLRWRDELYEAHRPRVDAKR